MVSLLKTLLLGVLAGVPLTPTTVPQKQEPPANQAAIVVRLGPDKVESRCIEFEEDEISGLDLLQRSNLAVEARIEGMGAAACQIEGTGCPAQDCFCQCDGGPSCIYWSYWHSLDGSWVYSQIGASTYPIRNGSIDGWSWGPGSLTNAVAPPDLSFNDVCTDSPTPETEAETNISENNDFAWKTYGGFVLLVVLLLGGIIMTRRGDQDRGQI